MLQGRWLLIGPAVAVVAVVVVVVASDPRADRFVTVGATQGARAASLENVFTTLHHHVIVKREIGKLIAPPFVASKCLKWLCLIDRKNTKGGEGYCVYTSFLRPFRIVESFGKSRRKQHFNGFAYSHWPIGGTTVGNYHQCSPMAFWNSSRRQPSPI